MLGYDIIIQAGQSNAQGYGYGETMHPYVPNDAVLYFCDKDFEEFDDTKYCSDGSGFQVVVAKERNVGEHKVCNFALSFANEYVKAGLLKEGRKILIIRCAIGATSFTRKRWGKTDDLFHRMLKAIDNSMKLCYGDNDHRFIAFLWHQGESDTDEMLSVGKYYNDLKYLVEAVREKSNVLDLPFIAGDFVQDWKNSSSEIKARCDVVILDTKKLCEDLSCSNFVESDGLLSNRQNPSCPNLPNVKNDNIHFCRDSQIELGKRYFKKFLQLKQ